MTEKVTFYVNTSDTIFIGWLQKLTVDTSGRQFPIEKGFIRLQVANESRNSDGNLRIDIGGTFITLDKTGVEVPHQLPLSVISFQTTPISSDSIKVTGEWFGKPPLLGAYFVSLLFEIARRWTETWRNIQLFTNERYMTLIHAAVEKHIQNWERRQGGRSRQYHYKTKLATPTLVEIYRNDYRIADITGTEGTFNLHVYSAGGMIEDANLIVTGDIHFVPDMWAYINHDLGLRLIQPNTSTYFMQPTQDSVLETDTNPAAKVTDSHTTVPNSVADITSDPSLNKGNSQKPDGEPMPWEKIPNAGWDRLAVRFLYNGLSDNEIANEINKHIPNAIKDKTVTNRLSELRALYPFIESRDQIKRKRLSHN